MRVVYYLSHGVLAAALFLQSCHGRSLLLLRPSALAAHGVAVSEDGDECLCIRNVQSEGGVYPSLLVFNSSVDCLSEINALALTLLQSASVRIPCSNAIFSSWNLYGNRVTQTLIQSQVRSHLCVADGREYR